MRPRARNDGLLVREVFDELVIYDQEEQRAHSLNSTVAVVWQNCDGHRTVDDLAALLHEELNLPVDQELVWLALRQLERAGLLQGRLNRPPNVEGVSRREVLRRVGSIAGATFLLPAIGSIVAPTPAMASTPPVCDCCVFVQGGFCISEDRIQCEGDGGVYFPNAECDPTGHPTCVPC
jgi:hypothetical protein